MVFYSHDLAGLASELRAMRVDKDGEPVWDDEYITISSANSSKGHLFISPFANGQWVLSWEGDRTGVNNVFAQNIQPDGSLGVVETFGSLSGHVEIEGDMADVTEATITIGDFQTHPDASGFFQIDELPPGTYEVTAQHPYTETHVVENVIIESGSLTENVDFMLNMLRRDLKLMVIDAEDNLYASVDFFVEGPEGSYSESSGADEYVYVLPNLPYGFYQGTATLMDGLAVVEAEAVLDADHDEMVFLFLEVGLQETALFTDMMVYPNPLQLESVLMVNSPVQGPFYVQVFSVAGRNIVSRHSINLFAGTNRLPLSDILPTGEMQAGIFILHLSDGKNSCSIQFVINK